MSELQALPEPYLEAPALHPRLLRRELREELAARWRAARRLRIPEVLAPGLAAELAPLLGALPLAPTIDPPPCLAMIWRCELQVPAQPDPQHGAPLYRLRRFLFRDLPELLAELTGQPAATAPDAPIRVEALRKGAHREGFAPGRLHAFLGLTGARWPQAWGGHLELRDGTGRVERWAPAWDALDLLCLAPGEGAELPLVLRHVEGLAVAAGFELGDD